jgi:hypothetical protein
MGRSVSPRTNPTCFCAIAALGGMTAIDVRVIESAAVVLSAYR